jgi:dienelactone hydrolase
MTKLVCLLLAALSFQAVAQTGGITSEMIATSLVEDGKPVRLELLVRKPEGPGPFPTVVFNHGSTGRGDNPARFRQSWSSPSLAQYFSERGWLVIFPQRRGRGASEGRYDEGFEVDRSRYSCQTELSLRGVDRAIEDLDAVMAHIRTRKDVVQDRILLAGQSRGGILSVAYAGERPKEFVGVVNFVGGWMGDGCANAAAINMTAFKRGARFARPTLWLYGERDPFYYLSHSKANFEAFTAAGGKGRFEAFSVPGHNAGHGLIAHPGLWGEHVTRYLQSLE